MGLIKALKESAGSVMADQWREYFYCEALDDDVLMTKGMKKSSGRSSNWRGPDNIISNGSIISVADGQCMMIVEQGKIVEVSAEPGEFIFDSSTEPSIFYGSLGSSIVDAFKTVGKRFTFGGEPPKDQRVYYFNTRELMGNKYGTPNPIQFLIVDKEAGIRMPMPIRCFGEYSYRLANPLIFYTKVAGNVADEFTRDRLDSQMKSELLTHLGPAFAKLSAMGIRYDQLMGHTIDIRDALKEELSKEWGEDRGIEIVNFGVSSLKGDEKIEAKLLNAMMYKNDPSALAAEIGMAQAEAMKLAAANENAGPAMAFMGMNMANQAGGATVQNLYQQGFNQQQTYQQMHQMNQQQVQQPAAPAASGWTCACGQTGNTGKFCSGCGKPKPAPAESWTCTCGATVTGKFCPECGAKRPEQKPLGWTCSCGAVNKGKFCTECGAKKPAGVPQYRCDKCGWEPTDPTHPPKFCPECGDPFDDGDIK